MLMLTRVKARFADVGCSLCGSTFAVAGVQVKASHSPQEREWLQQALQQQHRQQPHIDGAGCHAPSFPVFGPPLPEKRRRVREVIPAVGLPYSQPAALRYNG